MCPTSRRLSACQSPFARALCGVIKVASFKKAIRQCAYDIIMFAGYGVGVGVGGGHGAQ